MSKRYRMLPAVFLALLIVGCAGNRFQTGSAVREAANSGALLSSAVLRQLDKSDRRAIARAESEALETAGPNRPVSWESARSGRKGNISAGPSYFVNEQQCRDYAHTIYIDNEPQVFRGTACRSDNGAWQNIT